MKKFFVIALALALSAGAAYANYCARDVVPAATLLVPYAVVDMDGNIPDPNGYTTLLSVTNVSSERQLIHVTVWSPLSVPVVDFDEILSGYDVWTINFRDMLTGHFDYFDTEGVNGFWPGPADQGPDVTPYGPATNAGWQFPLRGPEDTDFGGNLDAADGCFFPYGYHPEYGAGIISVLRQHIFAIDLQYYCNYFDINTVPWQIALTDDPLFFYVTVDAVDQCSTFFPTQSSYWANGTIPDDDNVLLGELYYLNPAQNLSEALHPAHLEYDVNATANPNIDTFYEIALGFPNIGEHIYDGLEPLATAFAFRYYNSGGVSSNLMLWKNIAELDTYFGYWYAEACGNYVYYAWDENEKSKARSGGPSGFDRPEPKVIPFETQKVPLDVANWSGLMSGNGWMLLVFEPSLYGFEWNYYEAWAAVQHNFGGFSAALEAATMANTNCFANQTLGGPFYLGVNWNYTDGDGPIWGQF